MSYFELQRAFESEFQLSVPNPPAVRSLLGPNPSPNQQITFDEALKLFTYGRNINIFQWDDTPDTTGHWSDGMLLFAFEGAAPDEKAGAGQGVSFPS